MAGKFTTDIVNIIPNSSFGYPLIGTYTKGDIYIDASLSAWICTSTGTPGTWQSFSSSSSSSGVSQEYVDGSLAARDASLQVTFQKNLNQDTSITNLNNYVDGSLNLKVNKTGDSMSGALTISSGGLSVSNNASIGGTLYIAENVIIKGNLTTDGSITYINTQTISVSDNVISINTGLTGTPPSTLQSGIKVNRGTEEPYVFLFDETDDTFRIGVAEDLGSGSFNDASTQAVATREDNPIDTAVAIWNAASSRFDTSSNLTISTIATVDNIMDNVNVGNGLSKTEDGTTIVLGGAATGAIDISLNGSSFGINGGATNQNYNNIDIWPNQSILYSPLNTFVIAQANSGSKISSIKTSIENAPPYVEFLVEDPSTTSRSLISFDSSNGLHYHLTAQDLTNNNFLNASSNTIITKGYVDYKIDACTSGSSISINASEYSVLAKEGTNLVGYSGFTVDATNGASFSRTGNLTLNNEIIGYKAGNRTMTGYSNVIIGVSTGFSIKTGYANVYIGHSNSPLNTTGFDNTIIGTYAMLNASSSMYTTAVGVHALQNITTGHTNTALGAYAGRFVGSSTTENKTSRNSIYIGFDSRGGANGNENEIVVGYQTVGRGSNTAQWGALTTTNHYFSGNLRAKLLPPAQTTTAGTYALKFTMGDLLATPEIGAIEYDASAFLYVTDASAKRQQIVTAAYGGLNSTGGALTHTVGAGGVWALMTSPSWKLDALSNVDASGTTGLVTVTVNKGGRGTYLCSYQVSGSMARTGCDIYLVKNGTDGGTVLASGTAISRGVILPALTSSSGSGIIYMNEGDRIGIFTSGGSPETMTYYGLNLNMIRIGNK